MVSEQFISVVQGLDNYDILCRHLLANITLFKDDRISCYITLAGFIVVLFLSHFVSRLAIICRRSKLFHRSYPKVAGMWCFHTCLFKGGGGGGEGSLG